MKQNQPEITQAALLTPLERELMASIEALLTSLTGSNEQQSKAMHDTVSLLMQRLEALEASFEAFQSCQLAFNTALIGWAKAPDHRENQTKLDQAIKELKELEQAASSK